MTTRKQDCPGWWFVCAAAIIVALFGTLTLAYVCTEVLANGRLY